MNFLSIEKHKTICWEFVSALQFLYYLTVERRGWEVSIGSATAWLSDFRQVRLRLCASVHLQNVQIHSPFLLGFSGGD